MTDRPGISAQVSHERCVGVAACIGAAPDAFDVDDSGLSVFNPDGTWTEEQLIEAADACPSAAITVFKDGAQVR